MKPGFFLIIGTLLVCLSFGSALGGETKKQCPDPSIMYEMTISGQKYWEWFAGGIISDLIQGDKYICGIYSQMFEHGPHTFNFLVSKIEAGDYQKKETGFIKGITYLFRQYDHLLASKNEVVLSIVYKEFSEKFAPEAEIITGLKFDTAEEWFDWWETNKNRLVLSEDGKHLVVKK
ncbi:MAG: hypothetical protein IH886_01610 [Nitrospinae bacterium]|nr:hypothetical protein [Nitrospinota bacterium]